MISRDAAHLRSGLAIRRHLPSDGAILRLLHYEEWTSTKFGTTSLTP